MRSFPRTVDGAEITFDMEPKLPKLHNLASHVTECKGAKRDEKKDEPTSEEHMNIKRSAEIMEAFLKEGELNPEVVVTYKGFLRIFSAWIIDESLPWTAGEAPTLQMLFRYLKITYQLPSDTTIRNQLLQIFEELRGKVVREFAVCIQLLHERLSVSHSSSSFSQSNPKSPMQPIHGPLRRWCIPLHAQSGASSTTTGK